MAYKYISSSRYKSYIKRKFYKVNLEDMQKYFNFHVFYFEEDYAHEDHDEMLIRQYEEQALIFLRSIGAMLNVDAFLTIGNNIVYVRKLPTGIMPIQE
jgi:hypothetical protein